MLYYRIKLGYKLLKSSNRMYSVYIPVLGYSTRPPSYFFLSPSSAYSPFAILNLSGIIISIFIH